MKNNLFLSSVLWLTVQCQWDTDSGGLDPGAHTAVCPMKTPVLWNIQFECGLYHTAINSDESLADKFNKLHNLQTHGDCDAVKTNMFIENNPSAQMYGRKRREAAEEHHAGDGHGHRMRRQWDTDSGAVPTSYADLFPLHVLIVIDMDVDDDEYWSDRMPNNIKKHIAHVNFPFGTTFEIVLAGPNNIFVQYPISKPSMGLFNPSMVNQYSSTFSFINRKKREASDATLQFVTENPIKARKRRQWDTDSGGNTASATPTACHIFDKNVLYQRLFAATSSMPALPQSLYSVAGLNRADHIGWMSAYLHKYLPQHGNTLVMHVVNHESTVDHADVVGYQNFMLHLESTRPNLNLRHHYIFAGTSHAMPSKLYNLGVTMSATSRWSTGFSDYSTTQALVDGFQIGGGVGVITDPVAPVVTVPTGGTSCSNSPCQNGCSCEQSCRDENDYVCVPPAGRPFVGKNCEWEAVVQCTADRSIRVSIPKDAVAQYAMGVSNVVLQGCNNAPSYICNAGMGLPAPACGPVSAPTGNFYVLECPTNNLVRTSNGEFSFGQTIVFDRESSLVAMPHPIVNVQCMMATRPAVSVIAPQLRGPQSLTQTIFWQPMFGFYKTSWGSHPMILAGNSIIGSGEVGYIVGERIHVRITASLNGIPAATLPSKHQMSMQSCTITPFGSGGNVIPIISNGLPVAGTPFPVSVDQDPGLMGGGIPSSVEGVGFSFQVFTYGPGSKLQLTCVVHIGSARRRRSAANETEAEGTEKVQTTLLIFAPADEEKNDIPSIAMITEPSVEVVYVDSSEAPDQRAVQIEKLSNFILSELPSWFLTLLGLLVVLVLILAVFIVRRRYAAKYVDYDDGSKVRLFN